MRKERDSRLVASVGVVLQRIESILGLHCQAIKKQFENQIQ